jgi:hypothetical protein
MGFAGDAASLSSEVERLRAEVRQLQQERQRERAALAGLERVGKRTSFWDGTPERLPHLASEIRQAFGYKVVALSLFEAGSLRRWAIDPPDAQYDSPLSPQSLEQAIEENQPLLISGTGGDTLIVPLVEGMHLVGVLEIAFDGASTPGWSDLWRGLSPQVTSIITGGRLLAQVDEARQRQQLLHNITRRLTTTLPVA